MKKHKWALVGIEIESPRANRPLCLAQRQPPAFYRTSRALPSSVKVVYRPEQTTVCERSWGKASEKALGGQREGLSPSRDRSKYNEVAQRSHARFSQKGWLDKSRTLRRSIPKNEERKTQGQAASCEGLNFNVHRNYLGSSFKIQISKSHFRKFWINRFEMGLRNPNFNTSLVVM